MYQRRNPRREYDASPLQETRLAVYFQSPRPQLLPGLLYSAFRQDLPEYELIQKHAEVDQDTAEVRWGPDHMLSNSRRNLAVLLGSGYLAMIARQPYVGFSDFLDFSNCCWDKFKDIVEQGTIHQVRLLYQNLIALPSLEANPSEYVKGGVFIAPSPLFEDWSVEHMKADVVFQVSSSLSVRLISQVIGGSDPAITLNLEAISDGKVAADLGGWCQEANQVLGDLFEDFLTEAVKRTFQPRQIGETEDGFANSAS